MSGNRSFVTGALLLLVLGLSATSLGQVRSSSPVVVRLRRIAIATERVVDINTVATLTGGSYDVRRRIGRLDIAERPSNESSERITGSRVAMRIRLAGISARLYEVRGAETTVMADATSAPSRQSMLSEIHAGLSARLSVAPEELEVALVQAAVPIWKEYADRPGVRFEPVLPATPRIGEQKIAMSVIDGNQPLKTIPLTVDIRLRRPVPVATRNIARGEILSNGNVRFEVLATTDQQLSQLANVVFGRRAVRPIQRGKLIEAVDLQSDALQPDNRKLIKRRDTVRMVARQGGLQVIVANGEALEDGRLNEFISVRNPSSRKVVRGRVTGPSEIEVPF